MDVRWRLPFTCIVAGPTSCGKTVFVTRFLEHLREMTTPVPEEIIWCYGEWQPVYEQISGNNLGLHITWVEGLPTTSDFFGSLSVDKHRLMIIDDLMQETNERVTELFTKKSHHMNLSVIYLVQNIFGKNKELRTISLNSHYMVLFKNPRDSSQITHLAKQMVPGRVKYLQEAYKDATSAAHGYLLIDLKQETPEHLRYRTGIFPEDRHFVYLEK